MLCVHSLTFCEEHVKTVFWRRTYEVTFALETYIGTRNEARLNSKRERLVGEDLAHMSVGKMFSFWAPPEDLESAL